ncbi:MAG: hypothetical protein DRJ51_07215 [Thermoprotei archaeon]|nr:MAG: hypothetical protein DRJ51_07215 [Thermoprotei archaeon]
MFSPLFGYTAKVLIGTSGWSYDDWVDVFYEREERMFQQYTRVFDTAEINSTFYKIPPPSFIAGLARSSPRGFVFSVKLHKEITHKKMVDPKLAVERDVRNFLKLLDPLKKQDKLGAILVQLPPEPKEKFPRFEEFLDILASMDGYRFAVEFRDESWISEETWKMLRERNVAYCIVDEPLLPPITVVTTDFAYIRWHGRGGRPWYYYLYSVDELREWVPRVLEVAKKVKVIYGYFNNHFRGFAPRNALQILTLLGLATQRQRIVLKRMDEYFKTRALEKVKQKFKALQAPSVRDLLSLLVSEKRLKRAEEMSDKELRYEDRGSEIVCKIRAYKIVIDLNEKAIVHDCADWQKLVESKRFCKHLAKLFLSLPQERATKLLETIISELDDWDFRYGD